MQGGEAERNCKYCAVSATCALYLAADSHQAASAARGAAAGGSLPHGLHPGLSEQVVGVRPACAAFFAHWSRLVDLEEGAARGNQSEVRSPFAWLRACSHHAPVEPACTGPV